MNQRDRMRPRQRLACVASGHRPGSADSHALLSARTRLHKRPKSCSRIHGQGLHLPHCPSSSPMAAKRHCDIMIVNDVALQHFYHYGKDSSVRIEGLSHSQRTDSAHLIQSRSG